jgi:FMN phosphatase YigB (HAD superfamily)
MPGKRRQMMNVEAITLDFGNTLVAFPASQMAAVLQSTATLSARSLGLAEGEFLRFWTEERRRQMVEDVPEGREAYMDIRATRVLARLRGSRVPGPGARWNDADAATYSSPEELAAVLDAYATAFVNLTPAPPEIEPMLARLAASYRLAIISNWPLTMAIERFVVAAGWAPHLSAVVVSHEVGVIKPQREIFEVAAVRLGVQSGPAILHVGDDPGADVVGAHNVGWRAAWVRVKPDDSPLPVAPPAPHANPDLTIDSILDLELRLTPKSSRTR